MQETQKIQVLSRENPLEQEIATHSSILAWEIPRTEEPIRLQSLDSQSFWHDLANRQQQFSLKGKQLTPIRDTMKMTAFKSKVDAEGLQ